MKKLFFLIILFLATVPPVPLAYAQIDHTCPDGSTQEGRTASCLCPDGQLVPEGTPECPPAHNPFDPVGPVNQPPANNPPGGGTNPGPPVAGCDPTYNTTANGLCVPRPPICTGNNNAGIACGNGNFTALAAQVINILLYFSGIVAVIFVIIGGYRYMAAGGSEEDAGKGRKTMTNAIIGLVIVILAYVIINAVTNFLIK